jgi:hypothetical protein
MCATKAVMTFLHVTPPIHKTKPLCDLPCTLASTGGWISSLPLGPGHVDPEMLLIEDNKS